MVNVIAVMVQLSKDTNKYANTSMNGQMCV